jgi:hypothetical protein
MKEKILFTKKVKTFDVFLPLIITLIINIIYSLINSFNFYLFFGLIIFSVIYIYLTRYNAVEIKAYDCNMNVNFFILKKQITIEYTEIKDLKIVSSGVYGGSYLMFILNKRNDNIKFRIKIYDIEFIRFLEEKTKTKFFNQ